jgi:radical SAM superfamily enzyme YgiQ (UPF0313 family)
MNPNLVLINPRTNSRRLPFKESYAAREPLGLLAVASFLKSHGYDTKIIDAKLYEEEYIKKQLESYINSETVFIGFSVMTAQIPHALELSTYIKQINENAPIVWGGIHPTLFPEQTSVDPNVDLAVYGPGESASLEIIRRIEAGNFEFSGINSTAQSGIIYGQRNFEDINQLPYLDHNLLDLAKYLGPARHHLISEQPIKALNILSSRGCPWRCGFCVNFTQKNGWRALRPVRFLDELEYQVNKYGLKGVRILDEDFFVSKGRVNAIVKGLKNRNVNIIWGTNVRANYFNDNYISSNFAKELKDVGLNFLTFGAESGSDRVLKLLNKKINVKQLLRSAEICEDAGITPLYSWMIGIPGQSKKEMRSNISLMKTINEICPKALHTTNWIFRPLPGSDLYEMVKSMGLKEPKSVLDWAALEVELDYHGLRIHCLLSSFRYLLLI